MRSRQLLITATLLVTTAKSDPSSSVRSEAINWLPRLPGDAGVNSLEADGTTALHWAVRAGDRKLSRCC
jgi:hypothetical protein